MPRKSTPLGTPSRKPPSKHYLSHIGSQFDIDSSRREQHSQSCQKGKYASGIEEKPPSQIRQFKVQESSLATRKHTMSPEQAVRRPWGESMGGNRQGTVDDHIPMRRWEGERMKDQPWNAAGQVFGGDHRFDGIGVSRRDGNEVRGKDGVCGVKRSSEDEK
ncbi:MAG: hypothetical protein Q9164_005958 [Protoblastenia rupestris]